MLTPLKLIAWMVILCVIVSGVSVIVAVASRHKMIEEAKKKAEKEAKTPRPYSLVKFALSDEMHEQYYKGLFPKTGLVFLGEIPNQPDHGFIMVLGSGKIVGPVHVYDFVELTEE